MIFNKTIFKLALLTFSAALVTTNYAVAAPERNDVKIIKSKGEANPHLGNKIELMFFQRASQGQITKDKTNAHCYNVVLSGLKDHVIYFSTEPARVTGTLTLPQFMETWEHNEHVNRIKPNAILH